MSTFTQPTSALQQKEDQNSALKERVSYLEDLVKQVLVRLPDKDGANIHTSKDESQILQADAQAGMS